MVWRRGLQGLDYSVRSREGPKGLASCAAGVQECMVMGQGIRDD